VGFGGAETVERPSFRCLIWLLASGFNDSGQLSDRTRFTGRRGFHVLLRVARARYAAV
jgi:hypothetical protein